MLLTRCPGCRTTFRITVQALEAADGQVRCGRCSQVFDAREALSELPAAGEEGESSAMQCEAVAGADAGAGTDANADAADAVDAVEAAADASAAEAEAEAEAEAATEDPLARTDEFLIAADAFAEAADQSSVASVIAEIRRQQSDTDEQDDAAVDDSADESRTGDAGAIADEADFAGDDADARGDDAIPPEQVDAVLDGGPDEPKMPARPTWPPERVPEKQVSRWWAVAVAVAIVALAVQILHHYRSDLATHPALGDLLSGSYSRLGMDIVPSWDLAQYQIMEWVASAEADEQVQSSLNITARIQNRGPNPQPFPYVHLKLKDRWDMPVGSRVFRPAEYLDAEEAGALMQPGHTARARLRVVDPGEDAYGFELDVCVDAAQGGLRCATDEVFR